MQINSTFSVVTQSLLIDYYRIYPMNNLTSEFSMQNGSSFKYLTSFSNLIQNNSNYFDEIIFVQVNNDF